MIGEELGKTALFAVEGEIVEDGRLDQEIDVVGCGCGARFHRAFRTVVADLLVPGLLRRCPADEVRAAARVVDQEERARRGGLVVARPFPLAAPVDRAVEAREEAEAAGLPPLADAFASLRDNASLGSVTAAQARIGRVGAAERSERALVAGRVATRSEGVRTSEVSIEAGGAGLDGRETTRVVSTVAANGAAVAGGGAGGRSAVDPNARSREEVERVFDRNKGAIYALYDRALRQDPTVQGKFVVQLVIEPDGEVSEVEVLSSELGDVELECRLLQRIRMFRFEPRAVTRVVMTKPIDFFPV